MSIDPEMPARPPEFDLVANRYRLQQQIGKGTYGVVYRADDLKFNPPRAVALKVLHAKFLNEAGVRADIENEASVLARFNHPNILRVLDFDISENQAFIVTELADGGSLAAKIRPDPTLPPVPMPLADVAHYLEQICEAMDEAHTAGLIHRDLKPLNILLTKRGRPVVADFGLATALSSSQSSVLVDASTSGTPPYMAPEQWLGHAGKASDIYALGIITYQLITGQLPFQGDQTALAYQHLQAPIPRLSDRAPDLQYPPALDAVIAEVLAKDPKQRTRPALEFYRRFKEAIGIPGTVPVRPVTENTFSPTIAIPAPNYYPPTQPQQPAQYQPNAPVNPVHPPTQIPAQPPQGQGTSPFNVTQVPDQPTASASDDATKIGSQPSNNFQPNPGYPQAQNTGPYANNPAASNYDQAQVSGQAPYQQPVANFRGNQIQPPMVTRTKNNTPLLVSLAGLVVVLLVGGIAFLIISILNKPGTAEPGQAVVTATTAPAVAATAATLANKIVTYTGLSQDHVSGTVTYPQSPPVGGPHNPLWQNCGIYDVSIPNETAVHSLEHGVVWITYQPNLLAADVERLRSMVRGKGYFLLSPYPGLPSPVVATAWGVQLKLDSASDPLLAEFIDAYWKGDQTPEPGASCTDGVGTPIER